MIDLQKEDEKTDPSVQTNEEIVKQIYAFAANLLFEENQNREEVINRLIVNGVNAENAEVVVNNLISERKAKADKDILYGSLWCVGGVIATIADIGYIFWGAIVFGAIQLVKGLLYRWG